MKGGVYTLPNKKLETIRELISNNSHMYVHKVDYLGPTYKHVKRI